MMGFHIEGVDALLETHDVPIHGQADELPWVMRVTNCTEPDLVDQAAQRLANITEAAEPKQPATDPKAKPSEE